MSKVDVVIGAARGIGIALSRRIAAAVHTVHAMGRDVSKLEALTGELGGTWAAPDDLDRAALGHPVEAVGPVAAGLAYCVGSIAGPKDPGQLHRALAHQDTARGGAHLE